MTDELKAFFEQRHSNNVTDFGKVDRLIFQEEVQIWNFNTTVIKNIHLNERVAWDDVVKVYGTDGTLIGAATLFPYGKDVRATVSADYNHPDRLDFETGNPVFVMPVCEITSDKTTISHLMLTHTSGFDIWSE